MTNYRNSKFANQRVRYGGRNYQSKLECGDAFWLKELVKQGKIKEVQEQKRFDFYVNGKKICAHYVDFVVTLCDNRIKAVETKGFPTPVWAIKKKLFEALYPEIPYLVNPNERNLLE